MNATSATKKVILFATDFSDTAAEALAEAAALARTWSKVVDSPRSRAPCGLCNDRTVLRSAGD